MGACAKGEADDLPRPSQSMQRELVQAVRFLVVGQQHVGKTCLTDCFIQEKSQRDVKAVPTTTMNNFQRHMMIGGKNVPIEVVDMAGNYQAAHLVKKECQGANCILLCYSLISHESYQKLDDWLEEIDRDEFGINLPIVLVATKRDLASEHRAVE